LQRPAADGSALGELAGEGDLAIFERKGDGIHLTASSNAKLMVMDGAPIAEPIVGQGPIVMSTRAEIQQAFEDYQIGKMGKID
jgi:redox-sensitive bicupin YhaK (pirin superfamily)